MTVTWVRRGLKTVAKRVSLLEQGPFNMWSSVAQLTDVTKVGES